MAVTVYTLHPLRTAGEGVTQIMREVAPKPSAGITKEIWVTLQWRQCAHDPH